MILLLVAATVVLGRVAVLRSWPGTATAARWWARYRAPARAYVRSAPATFTYLAILTVTTWVLVGASPTAVNALLREQSTTVQHLTTDPVRVLIRSAFWLADYQLLLWAALFVVVLAPAERWLGTSRWLVAFAIGHVGATLLVAVGLWAGARTGLIAAAPADAIDVGVSYGFTAVAALLTFRLAGNRRLQYAAVLLAIVLGSVLFAPSFTTVGHAIAASIGLGLYPLVRPLPRQQPPGRTRRAVRATP